MPFCFGNCFLVDIFQQDGTCFFYIISTVEVCTVNVLDITCQKLNSKYESLYLSYHVNILVTATDMKPAIETYMSPDSWPVGVFVKRFFKAKPKDVSEQ